MLQEIDDPDLAVYVIWSDQLGAEERHVADAAALIPDSRAIHYWDPEKLAGSSFQDQVGTSSPAWDVWLLFDRDAAWTPEANPKPAWWAHQLGELPPDRRLDPERFADKAKELLGTR